MAVRCLESHVDKKLEVKYRERFKCVYSSGEKSFILILVPSVIVVGLIIKNIAAQKLAMFSISVCGCLMVIWNFSS